MKTDKNGRKNKLAFAVVWKSVSKRHWYQMICPYQRDFG